MKLKLPFVFACLGAIFPSLTLAEPTEAQISKSMKALGGAWQEALAKPAVFRCIADSKFAAVLAQPGTRVVDVDLRRTTSLLNPYRGIVFIHGEFGYNLNSKDRSCLSNSPEEARARKEYWAHGFTYAFEVYYHVVDDNLELVGGNTVFLNNFMRAYAGPPKFILEDDPVWQRVFKFPVQ